MHWQTALLMAAPLALYLGLLACWHGGRRPVVISGPADVALLSFGLGGVVLFGPFGQAIVGWLPGPPRKLVWVGLALWLALLVLQICRRAAHTLVVYHVDAAALERALTAAFDDRAAHYLRTRDGFEGRTRLDGVRIDFSPRWHTATLEVYGDDPASLLRQIEPRLRAHLRGASPSTPQISQLFLAGALAAMLFPLTIWVFSQAETRAAVRQLMQRIFGG